MLIKKDLIAPCGMDCGLCKSHLRKKDPCLGCNNVQIGSKTRVGCKIRICSKRKGKFCFYCKDFPCNNLKHLDERYRNKYCMSEINNLKYIKKHGIDKFVEKENKKWISKKGIFCVHDKKFKPFHNF